MGMTKENRALFEKQLVQGYEPWEMGLDLGEFQRNRLLARVGMDLSAVGMPKFGIHGRRLNNFCIGSDPEFVFVAPGSGHKTHAAELGLKPGLAAGCDQNQRLAELRGWPTTSAVEHVAGILSALRWMYRVYPAVRPYYWRAGAFYDNDGIGGHVHFGRKRPNRPAEVAGLDGVATSFRSVGIFPNAEWFRRTQGDPHRQIYGRLGDIRPQLHGYEYRTLPSWLCNPTKAFVVLTATKLSVLDPELTAAWLLKTEWTPPDFHRALTYLARYYAGRDDDAWLLKYLLVRPEMPFAACERDFKIHWGFPKGDTLGVGRTTTNIIPACIRPDSSEITEISESILQAKPLVFREVAPTFKNTIPEGYFWYPDRGVTGITRGGVGDITGNLVGSVDRMLNLVFGSDQFRISADIIGSWTLTEYNEFRRLFPECRIYRDRNQWLEIPRYMTEVANISRARKLLLKMGLFPLWTVDSVTELSYTEWKEYRKLATGGKKRQPRTEERTI